ncbi:MAG: hypothetical protein ACREBC_26855, partial [Pyrinomonadaceae bacterium]
HTQCTLSRAEQLARLRKTGEELCIVPQNLIEFWAVATRPLAENGLELTIDEAVQETNKLKGCSSCAPMRLRSLRSGRNSSPGIE